MAARAVGSYTSDVGRRREPERKELKWGVAFLIKLSTYYVRQSTYLGERQKQDNVARRAATVRPNGAAAEGSGHKKRTTFKCRPNLIANHVGIWYNKYKQRGSPEGG